ncbi:hypothetical protein ACLOJK_008343 [Asimina triloba]
MKTGAMLLLVDAMDTIWWGSNGADLVGHSMEDDGAVMSLPSDLWARLKCVLPMEDYPNSLMALKLMPLMEIDRCGRLESGLD